jgi:hypothetical protein
MEKVKITLVFLGYKTKLINKKLLKKWKSALFQIVDFQQVNFLPNCQSFIGETLVPEYCDKQLRQIIHTDIKTEITVGIINERIEENCYMRILDKNSGVISVKDVDKIIASVNKGVEDFIFLCLYELITIYRYFDGMLSEEVDMSLHQESRGCLFDLCGDKEDIVYSFDELSICDQCRELLKQRQLPDGFLNHLDKELKRFNTSKYQSIINSVKRSPFKYLIYSVLFAILLNLVSNVLYDLIKSNYNRTTTGDEKAVHEILN